MRAEVVPEVSAYPRKVVDKRYTKFFQLISCTDTRQHQQLGRPNGTRAKDYTFGFDVEDFAATFGFHTDGFLVLNQNLPYRNAAPNCEI